jgi:hypothetical protein
MQPVILLQQSSKSEGSAKVLSLTFEPHGTELAVAFVGGAVHIFSISWPEQDPDQRPPMLPTLKVKDTEKRDKWIWYSAKSLRLCGVTAMGLPFKVVYGDDQGKPAGSASLDVDSKCLALK